MDEADKLYEDLWKIEKNNGDLSEDEQLLVSENICYAARNIGYIKQEKMDFIGLSKCVKDVRLLWEENNNSDNITEKLIELLTALFYLKHVFKEFFYIEDYITEILELSKHYAENKEIATASVLAIANLVELCYNGWDGLDIIPPLMDRLIAIARTYPDDTHISLVYLRSLTTFCCTMQSPAWQDIYLKYKLALNQDVWRLDSLPKNEASELYSTISEWKLVEITHIK
jgi:hypothetical protein